VITTEGEAGVTANLNRKSIAADRMFEQLVLEMNNAVTIKNKTEYKKEMECPSWL
jgi:hypothetical protein